jgi:hypothetical protein
MIEFGEPDGNWLDGLPSTPKRVLTDLLNGGTSPEDAIELWLGGSRQSNIAGMGGSGKHATYSALFVSELRLLICTDDLKYKDIRAQMPKINKGTLVVATGVVSTALASSLGMATGIIAPAVVLGFMTIAKVGVAVWCARVAPQ